MAKRVQVDEGYYIVLPPKPTSKNVLENCITAHSLSPTEEGAWDKFLSSSLVKKAYEEEGYKAYKVKILVETLN